MKNCFGGIQNPKDDQTKKGPTKISADALVF